MFHYPYNHPSDCHTRNTRASHSRSGEFIAVCLWDPQQPIKWPCKGEHKILGLV